MALTLWLDLSLIKLGCFLTKMTEQQLNSIITRFAKLAIQQNLMMATAESCTGGLIAKTATDLMGSSQWFSRGIVTYSNTSKQELLGVTAATLQQFGAVSEQIVLEMVEGLLTSDEVDIGVAVSGIAGPGGGSKEKPVGTVWISWKYRNNTAFARCFHFDGNRHEIRLQACSAAISGLIGCIENDQ